MARVQAYASSAGGEMASFRKMATLHLGKETTSILRNEPKSDYGYGLSR